MALTMTRVCKNCNDRHPACWGSCEKYRAARADYDAAMAAHKAREARNSGAKDVLFRSIERQKRNKR